MKRLNNDIILAFVVALIVASPLIAQTRQTIAEARATHNAAVCEAAKQPQGCNQASIPEGGGTIYSTDASFRDGVILPEMLDRRTEQRNNRIFEAVNRAFQSLTPAERVAVCTAFPRAKLADPEVCR